MRILVIRLSAMGDVIHALPAVASLKHSLPHSTITWVIRPRWATLLEGNPFVDEIVAMPRSFAGVVAAITQLRKQRYDAVVDFQGLMQSALVGAWVTADKKIGHAPLPGAGALCVSFLFHRRAHPLHPPRRSMPGAGRRRRSHQRPARLSLARRQAGRHPPGGQFRARVSLRRMGFEGMAHRILRRPRRQFDHAAGDQRPSRLRRPPGSHPRSPPASFRRRRAHRRHPPRPRRHRCR